ncbi:MAG: class I SAM-dependent methyltransferase [Methanothrix sp.]
MKEMIKAYWDGSADGYSRFVNCGMRSRRRVFIRDVLAQEIGKTGKRVLDVGTGPGTLALILAEMGHDVTGLDFSEEMLSRGRENARRFGLDVDFIRGDAEDLKFEDGSFDVVICRALMWTLTQPEEAVAEWKRVLRPGGMVAVIDGSWNSERGSIKRKAWRMVSLPLIMITERRISALGHYSRSLQKSLPLDGKERPGHDIALLQSAGFRDVKSRTMRRSEEGLMEYIKYGCYGDNFIVTGAK